MSTSAVRNGAGAAAVVVALAACSALVVGLAAARGGSTPSTHADVALAATGTVVAPQQLSLTFAGQGRLIEVDIHAGERVAAGTVLARLDPGPALAGVRTAAANLAAARAQLVQLRQGLSRGERAQLRIGLQQSQGALATARQALADARASAAQDATRLQTAVAQANAQLAADQAKLGNDQAALDSDQSTANKSAAQVTNDRGRLASDQAALLAAQKKEVDDQAAPASSTTLATDAKTDLDAQAAVAADQAQLSDDSGAAANARSPLASDQAQIAADQVAIAADENALTVARNAQAGGAAAARQSLDAARSAVDAGTLTVAATDAGNAVHAERPGVGTLATTRAAVRVSEAALATADEALRETRLVAPFAGTIAAVNAVPGQIVAGGANGLITLVNLDDLTVTASFDGAEAALLAPGQAATVTIPALAGQRLSGRVLSVDPLPDPAGGNAEPGYTARVTLSAPPAGLRPGMAAQLSVTARATLGGRS